MVCTLRWIRTVRLMKKARAAQMASKADSIKCLNDYSGADGVVSRKLQVMCTTQMIQLPEKT